MNKHRHEDGRPFTKEEFLKKLETDNEFNIEFGNKGIDQISDLIKQLKENPDSRRLIVNAWAVDDLSEMVLPPCHYGFQVYTRELSLEERCEYDSKKDNVRNTWKQALITFSSKEVKKWLDEKNVPKRAISLMWNQRSVDTFLGLPFNIASYGLLLEIIAKEVDMIPDQLIGNLGDVHLYSNHIEQAKEQIGRFYTAEERVNLLRAAIPSGAYEKLIDGLVPFGGGMSEYYDSYKIPHTSREPFELPKLKIESDVKRLDGDCLPTYSVSDFIIENYQSHPTIKAPLSN